MEFNGEWLEEGDRERRQAIEWQQPNYNRTNNSNQLFLLQ